MVGLPTNRFSGVCYICGLVVQPNTGRFERYGSTWRVKHAGPNSTSKRKLVTCEQARQNKENNDNRS